MGSSLGLSLAVFARTQQIPAFERTSQYVNFDGHAVSVASSFVVPILKEESLRRVTVELGQGFRRIPETSASSLARGNRHPSFPEPPQYGLRHERRASDASIRTAHSANCGGDNCSKTSAATTATILSLKPAFHTLPPLNGLTRFQAARKRQQWLVDDLAVTREENTEPRQNQIRSVIEI